MQTVSIVALALLAVTTTLAKPNWDWDHYEAPEQLQKDFPYYLSGFDASDRPIWVFEMGKYPIHTVLEKGIEADFEKYIDQAIHRLTKSVIQKNPKNKQAHILIDIEGITVEQFSDPKATVLIQKISKVVNVTEDEENIHPEPAVVDMVNVGPVISQLLTALKSVDQKDFENVNWFGTDKAEYIPLLLKKFPKDQIPEQYGGEKDFKPLMTYG